MKPYNFQVHIRAEFLDPEGKVIRRTRWKRARSYVCAFIDHLGGQMAYTSLDITDTGGVIRNLGNSVGRMRVDAGAGVTIRGIVIGTGTDAVLISDYKLGTQVTTNIDHSSVTVSAPVTDGTTRLLEVVRTFTNNTGAVLNVTEVGLYCMSGAADWKFCLDRSLYNVTINNGASASLRYRIKVTV